MTAVVWIRRSLRTYDNTALVEASKQHEELIPFYVVDENYFEQETLGYPRVRFWRESLLELKKSLRDQGNDLVVRKGKPLERLEEIVEETGADTVYFNRDYTPYSRERDQKVHELGSEKGFEVESVKDTVLHEKKEILTNDGDPYRVFTYYKKKWFMKDKPRPEEPEDFQTPEIGSDEIPSLQEMGYEEPEEMDWIWNPGREGGKKRLEQFKEKIWNYGDNRDYPAKEATSKLSPHLKFGTVSPREVFWAAERVKARNPDSDTSGIETWQEELAWREFYFQLLWNHPETVEEPMQEKYSSLEWRNREEAEEDWNRFVNGRTGFPIVDAGMRQLKRTGWMHNRLRMIVTSFACKDLWLDWHDLHDYFSSMFVDAEVSAMIGGIQWAYSIGTDAQPYFRVFNPWTQGEKFDPDGEFIREMVPELSEVPDQYIHRPQEMPKTVQIDSGCEIGKDYPQPIVDHDEKRKEAVERFERAGGDG